MRTLLAALALLTLAATARAQLPCSDPVPTTVVLDPTAAVAQLPQHDLLGPDGNAVIVGYEFGWLLADATEPIQPLGEVAPAAWEPTPEAGCYRFAGLRALTDTLVGRPVAMGAFRLSLRARGAAGQLSGWAVSRNPFGLAPALEAPSHVTLEP